MSERLSDFETPRTLDQAVWALRVGIISEANDTPSTFTVEENNRGEAVAAAARLTAKRNGGIFDLRIYRDGPVAIAITHHLGDKGSIDYDIGRYISSDDPVRTQRVFFGPGGKMLGTDKPTAAQIDALHVNIAECLAWERNNRTFGRKVLDALKVRRPGGRPWMVLG